MIPILIKSMAISYKTLCMSQKYSESYQMRVSSEEKGRALITLKNTNLLQFHDEDVAGNLLDWAIAAKRAGLMHECIQAIQVS